jgi:hypothetical protein
MPYEPGELLIASVVKSPLMGTVLAGLSSRRRPSLFPSRLVVRTFNAVARIAGGHVPRGVKGKAFASHPTL